MIKGDGCCKIIIKHPYLASSVASSVAVDKIQDDSKQEVLVDGYKVAITNMLQDYCVQPSIIRMPVLSAGDGSLAILYGRIGYCQHTGKVLQVVWFDGECFSELRIWDGKKYKLEVINNKLTVEECKDD